MSEWMKKASHVDVYGNSFPGKRNCKCKGPRWDWAWCAWERARGRGAEARWERREDQRIGLSQRCLGPERVSSAVIIAHKALLSLHGALSWLLEHTIILLSPHMADIHRMMFVCLILTAASDSIPCICHDYVSSFSALQWILLSFPLAYSWLHCISAFF